MRQDRKRLIAQGYLYTEVWEFINQIRARELENAIGILNEEPA